MRRGNTPSDAPGAARRPCVLHIITRMDAGGSATNTRVSVERQRAFGFDTELLYGATVDPDGALRSVLTRQGITTYVLPQLVREPSPWNDWRALLAIVRLLRRRQYDLVHTHTSKAGMLGRLACRWVGVPVVHTPHGHIFYGYFNRWVTAFYVGLERWMARYCRYIVSLTENETTESLARGIGRSEQYVTVPSGVPLQAFLRPADHDAAGFRAALGIAPATFLFVSVGRLEPIKGYDILLEAFGRLLADAGAAPAPALLILGAGAERARLDRQVEEMRRRGAPDAQIIFTGEQADVRPALWSADAFVLASRNEGMGRVYVEALAAGLPVIGTDVGGVAHVIRDGVNGLLAPGNDPAALAAAMRRMAGDAPARRAMSARAPDSVFPAYDETTMVQKLAELYHATLAGGRA